MPVRAAVGGIDPRVSRVIPAGTCTSSSSRTRTGTASGTGRSRRSARGWSTRSTASSTSSRTIPASASCSTARRSSLEDYLAAAARAPGRPRGRGAVPGGIAIGPWYVQPDSLLPSGEAHVRNLLEGRRVGAALGPVSAVAYCPDSFGHPAQFPQLFAGFGLGPFVYWRGNGDEIDALPSEWTWEAPDGSTVGAHVLRQGYFSAAGLPTDVEAAAALAEDVARGAGGVEPGGHRPPHERVRPRAARAARGGGGCGARATDGLDGRARDARRLRGVGAARVAALPRRAAGRAAGEPAARRVVGAPPAQAPQPALRDAALAAGPSRGRRWHGCSAPPTSVRRCAPPGGRSSRTRRTTRSAAARSIGCTRRCWRATTRRRSWRPRRRRARSSASRVSGVERRVAVERSVRRRRLQSVAPSADRRRAHPSGAAHVDRVAGRRRDGRSRCTRGSRCRSERRE